MGGPSQNHFSPEPAVVKDLENKLADFPDEFALLYHQLRADSAVVMALRYLTLAVIASDQNLYSEHRSAAVLVDEISRQMNATDPVQLLTSIRYLKLRYALLYRMNPHWFNRAAASAVDCINRAVVGQSAQPEMGYPVTNSSLDFEEPVPDLRTSRLRFDPAHPPHQVGSFSWRECVLNSAFLVAAAALAGLMFNLDRLNFPQLQLATTTGPDQSSATVVVTAPSPSPTTANDNSDPTILVESGRSLQPLPTITSVSQIAQSPAVVQPGEDYGQYITNQLSSSLYRKVVIPATPAQSLTRNKPARRSVEH